MPKHWVVPNPHMSILPHFPFAHYTPATVASFLFQEPSVPLPWNVHRPSLYLANTYSTCGSQLSCHLLRNVSLVTTLTRV